MDERATVPEKKSAPAGMRTSTVAAEQVLSRDLEACPRCGNSIEEIIWGKTNCPRCGLHFECC